MTRGERVQSGIDRAGACAMLGCLLGLTLGCDEPPPPPEPSLTPPVRPTENRWFEAPVLSEDPRPLVIAWEGTRPSFVLYEDGLQLLKPYRSSLYRQLRLTPEQTDALHARFVALDLRAHPPYRSCVPWGTTDYPTEVFCVADGHRYACAEFAGIPPWPFAPVGGEDHSSGGARANRIGGACRRPLAAEFQRVVALMESIEMGAEPWQPERLYLGLGDPAPGGSWVPVDWPADLPSLVKPRFISPGEAEAVRSFVTEHSRFRLSTGYVVTSRAPETWLPAEKQLRDLERDVSAYLYFGGLGWETARALDHALRASAAGAPSP